MTASRAQRRTRSIEHSPAVSRQAKWVEPARSELNLELGVLAATSWEKDLFYRFPFFFRAVHHPDSYPANISRIGITCGGGWYKIIEELASDVELELRTFLREQLQFPEKISELDSALASGRAVYPVLPFCTDIRHADGELKIEVVYGSLCPIDVWGRIRMYIEIAEKNSRCTCEGCGNPGKFREFNWQRVYCDDCITPDFSPKRSATTA